MTGPEVTAAVRRGAEAFETAWNEALDAADQSDRVAFIEGVFRKALETTLDVPRMASAIVDHLCTDTLSDDSETLVCACGHVLVTGGPDDDRDPQAEHATHHAALIRTALIGEGS